MELIRINDRKLKIMMTSEDMAEYELDPENIDYDNAETRRALRLIFDEAKQRVGVDLSSERVFVQLYRSKKGGCEMYVTKLGENECNSTLFSKKRVASVYRFDEIEWLLAACATLDEYGYSDESAAYFDSAKGGYYLLLSENESGVYPSSVAFLREFGTRVENEKIHMYIKEYCKCICRSLAVEKLSGVL